MLTILQLEQNYQKMAAMAASYIAMDAAIYIRILTILLIQVLCSNLTKYLEQFKAIVFAIITTILQRKLTNRCEV